MSSTNAHFTFNYSQPEEYHFSHDSVFLARQVFELLAPQGFAGRKILDLCAGCGVIGLDFLFHCHKESVAMPERVDFLEVQEIYTSHFTENLQRAGVFSDRTQFIVGSYANLSSRAEKYDLVLCNPPYFRVGQGKLSPSEFKNRCRFFIDSDFETLLNELRDCLKPYGEAYFLLRDLKEHGWDVEVEARNIMESAGELVRLGDIRGTGLMRFKRNNS